jgi:hypothetical protein
MTWQALSISPYVAVILLASVPTAAAGASAIVKYGGGAS